MSNYTQAARRWIEPLLALGVGGNVSVRFLVPTGSAASELGIVAPDPDSPVDYPAANSFVRELRAEEIATLGGQLRLGAREVLLSAAFVDSVAAAQSLFTAREVFDAATGLLIGGQICRIHTVRPLDLGDGEYAWQLLCDAPLEAS
jgi:hypothetical protein